MGKIIKIVIEELKRIIVEKKFGGEEGLLRDDRKEKEGNRVVRNKMVKGGWIVEKKNREDICDERKIVDERIIERRIEGNGVNKRIEKKRDEGYEVKKVLGYVEKGGKEDNGEDFKEMVDLRVLNEEMKKGWCRRLGIGEEKIRVVGREVIEIEVVLKKKIKIEIIDDRDLKGKIGVIDVVRWKIRIKKIEERRKIRRLIGKENIDIERKSLEMKRIKEIVGGIEIWKEMKREEKEEIKIVGKMVIGE